MITISTILAFASPLFTLCFAVVTPDGSIFALVSATVEFVVRMFGLIRQTMTLPFATVVPAIVIVVSGRAIAAQFIATVRLGNTVPALINRKIGVFNLQSGIPNKTSMTFPETMPFFTVETTEGAARAGVIATAHGQIKTPVFMPVGTQGTVKAVEHRELLEAGAQIILGNTYHLYLRPGEEVISHFGGLHRFMNWNLPILTDSGGFQVFSLKDLRKISERGVEFRSHIDGSKHFFTPESVIETQRIIGSDIVMPLDECAPFPSDYNYAKQSMEMTVRWAARNKSAFDTGTARYGHEQYLFAIGQGSIYPELRANCIEQLTGMDFAGYAIGGLAVGEDAEIMYEIAGKSAELLPEHKPRYLMGVGTPENLLTAIGLGIDMFDCVMPTRNARNGTIFTTRGKINIRNRRNRLSEEPIDEGIDNYASQNFTMGYLRHLFVAGELTGLQLASLQNVAFYQWLIRTARQKILSGEYRQWARFFLDDFNRMTKERAGKKEK